MKPPYRPDPRQLNFLRDPISRRSALKLLGLGALATHVPACATPLRRAEREARIEGIGPIDRGLPTPAPREFSGDGPDRAHRILWAKESYLAGRPIPAPAERVPLVVIGGGVSGLASAYLLRRHRPIVLERAPRFGGNARGESWDGIDYSIGAAYFMEPELETPLRKLLEETGIDRLCRKKPPGDPIVYRGKRYPDFWEGGTDPDRRAAFTRLHRHFADVYEERNGQIFPELPLTDPSRRADVARLDRIPFRRHLEKIAGGKLHPHAEAAIEHFCWSSFGAPAGEIGAAAGLNFLASELGPMWIAPGGNAGAAERFLELLVRDLPSGNLRPDSVVFDVAPTPEGDGVRVAYEDARGEIRSIHAQAVVLACPKFAAAKMVPNLEPARLAAFRKLRYNSYLVANVLLDGPVRDDFYDLFIIGEGRVDAADPRASSNRQPVTDVVLGTYARPHAERSVLTLYRPLPYAGARGEILSPGAYDGVRAAFESQIVEGLLPLVGADPKRVRDLRIARWGHPLPTASPGLFADGTIDALRKPFRDRVFFVQQDNWMLPAFETATGEALHFAPRIDRLLSGKTRDRI